MMQNIAEPEGKFESVSPLFMSMLSTTIGWLVNEEELNRAVEADLDRNQ